MGAKLPDRYLQVVSQVHVERLQGELSIRVFVLRRILLLRKERHGLTKWANSLQDVMDE